MYFHKHLNDKDVRSLIQHKKITFSGWKKGKIYGLLSCKSGKTKMSRETRVFFKDENEAIKNDYRPCAKCMPEAYKTWKSAQKKPSKGFFNISFR